MPNIFDNITPGSTLLPVLQHTIETAYRADFCVGYFNLRGWRAIADSVERFAGGDGNSCRVLIGMQSRPQDEFYQAMTQFSMVKCTDNTTAIRLKHQLV